MNMYLIMYCSTDERIATADDLFTFVESGRFNKSETAAFPKERFQS